MDQAAKDDGGLHRAGLLRMRGAGAHARVTNIELFFDLVFVFAVTQLSHTLLERLSLQAALETGLLFLAVWWVWIYTTWCTNWLDPDRIQVRVLLFALMLAGLLMSCALPHAFDAEGLLFATGYVAMQLGRTLFMGWAVPSTRPELRRNFQRVAVWLAVSSVLWIAGALSSHDARVVLWTLAIAVEYVSPMVGFRVPGLGSSHSRDWDIDGGHVAERCSLFIMIALGESILVTGATAAATRATAAADAAFVVAFLGSVAMWWIYFNIGAERGTRQIASADDPGHIARLAYTYLHLPIVAGIVVAAVADELVLAHPGGHVELPFVAVTVGGPLLFLLGNLAFKRVLWRRAPLSHLAGTAMLGVAAVLAPFASPLALATVTTAILLVVAAWETASLGRGR